MQAKEKDTMALQALKQAAAAGNSWRSAAAGRTCSAAMRSSWAAAAACHVSILDSVASTSSTNTLGPCGAASSAGTGAGRRRRRRRVCGGERSGAAQARSLVPALTLVVVCGRRAAPQRGGGAAAHGRPAGGCSVALGCAPMPELRHTSVVGAVGG